MVVAMVVNGDDDNEDMVVMRRPVARGREGGRAI